MQLSTEINGTASLQPSLDSDFQVQSKGRHLVDIKEHDELRLIVNTATAAVLQSRLTTGPYDQHVTFKTKHLKVIELFIS